MRQYRSFIYDSSRWEGFRFRAGDIVISTPPKAGTTWTQRICALLVFQTPELDKPLTTLSPWIDMLTRPLAEIRADLEAQTHRRFIKTHTPLDGLVYDERVTYICVGRDPRDIALSWDNHIQNMNPEGLFGARERTVGSNDDIAGLMQEIAAIPEMTEEERFWHWVDDPTAPEEAGSSLAGVANHVSTFWGARSRPNVVLLHYADLKKDLEGEMRRLAGRLSIDVPEQRWPALVEAATFEQMKRSADKTAPGVTESIWQNNARFFHRGTSGQWRSVLQSEEALARYNARLASLADPAVIAWMHEGSK